MLEIFARNLYQKALEFRILYIILDSSGPPQSTLISQHFMPFTVYRVLDLKLTKVNKQFKQGKIEKVLCRELKRACLTPVTTESRIITLHNEMVDTKLGFK